MGFTCDGLVCTVWIPDLNGVFALIGFALWVTIGFYVVVRLLRAAIPV